jgi:hypothetical protein
LGVGIKTGIGMPLLQVTIGIAGMGMLGMRIPWLLDETKPGIGMPLLQVTIGMASMGMAEFSAADMLGGKRQDALELSAEAIMGL